MWRPVVLQCDQPDGDGSADTGPGDHKHLWWRAAVVTSNGMGRVKVLSSEAGSKEFT